MRAAKQPVTSLFCTVLGLDQSLLKPKKHGKTYSLMWNNNAVTDFTWQPLSTPFCIYIFKESVVNSSGLNITYSVIFFMDEK